jgi:photosystem II stability/assembly factor-like uncharacterized protein
MIRSALRPLMKSIIRYSAMLLVLFIMCINQSYTQSGWISQPIDYSCNFYGVWFTDANRGIAVGAGPTIIRTIDAGYTWDLPNFDNVGMSYFAGVCFSDTLNGWVTGIPGVILRTRDGGTKWTQQSSGTSVNLETVFCIDTNIAWAAGGEGTILKTTNGGSTWISQTSGITGVTAIWDIFFTDSLTGTAVGGNCTGCVSKLPPSYILRTINGGNNWTIQKFDSLLIGYHGVFFTNDSTGTVVGENGTILRTTNGGITWTSQTSGTTLTLWDIKFCNADTGFIVGGDGWPGIILHTTNGGALWTVQEIPIEYGLSAISLTDANTGTAVGNAGTILRTTNGGVTWIEETIQDEPEHLSLSQNYPNPFNISTTIKFQIPNSDHVTLKIYTMHGEEIVTLVNEQMRPGSYEARWDATNYPSGVYFYKLKAGSFAESRKMVVVR